MVDLAPAERLQPSLLDRLTDDEPDKRLEGRDRSVISPQRLREIVLRDLGLLLNTGNLATVEDLGAWPDVARSVINYGIPDLSGLTVASLDAANLERALRQAILDYEPRILPRSLRIKAVVARDEMSQGALLFEIKAEMWAQPAPIGLSLRTEIDLELRRVVVTEHSG
jgi:type VI secretion system protein ImpF